MGEKLDRMREAARGAAAPPDGPPAPTPDGPRKPRPPKDPKARDERHRAKGRLPDRSHFDGLVWDAASRTWSGYLSVPTDDPLAPAVFRGTAGGVFQLLDELDDQYRAWKLARVRPAGAANG